MLLCGHSLCATCVRAVQRDGSVACPLCRQPTPAAPGLKINFALVDLLASIAAAPPAPKEMCNECE